MKQWLRSPALIRGNVFEPAQQLPTGTFDHEVVVIVGKEVTDRKNIPINFDATPHGG